MKRILLHYSLPAALLLGGALPVIFFGVGVGESLFHISDAVGSVLFVVVGLGGLCLAGGLWGRSVALASGYARRARAFWVAGLAFVVLTFASAQTLGTLEQLFVEQRVAGPMPIYIIFAILFTLASFVATALLMLVIGWMLRGWRFGLQLAWQAGLASATTFLLADVIQDLLGRRVGGPNAAATITMLSVAFIGNFLAAGAGGTVLGWRLSRTAAANPLPAAAAPQSIRSPL